MSGVSGGGDFFAVGLGVWGPGSAFAVRVGGSGSAFAAGVGGSGPAVAGIGGGLNHIKVVAVDYEFVYRNNLHMVRF